jgi:hypothetical protein
MEVRYFMRNPIQPKLLLQLEGLATLLVGLVLYREVGASWWLFLALVLAPDLAFLGYVIHKRVGVGAYNVTHTYLAPAVLFTAGFLAARSTTMAIGLIWAIHIGVDRLLGFGLKYDDAPFRETHLQKADNRQLKTDN